MQKRILFFILIIGHLVCSSISAVEIDSCQKVTITGDPQWPPYVILAADTGDLLTNLPVASGIGIDIAEQMFAELDVTVEIITYTDQLHMLDAIRKGNVDLLVSTYKYDEVAEVATFLEPSLTVDPITIAVATQFDGTIYHWEDLVGKKGVIDQSLLLDDQTQQYISTFLTVERIGTLPDAITAVKNGQYDYVIGTTLQLSYELNKANVAKDLVVQSGINRGGDVYMAYAKASPCSLYVTYLNKRLQDYQNNGTVEQVKKKYLE